MFFRLDYENSRPYKGFQLKNTSKIQDPTFWHLRTSCPHLAQCATGYVIYSDAEMRSFQGEMIQKLCAFTKF